VTLDRDLVVRALPAYDIGEEIGRGGWALVLHARHRSLGRPVAVKQLPRAFAADPAVLERFRAEARVVAHLNHPHIVPVHDFVEHDGVCLLVMELMEPYSLWERFVAHGISLDVACGLALAASAALQYAHDQGVLHRDVKPENLLFSAQGVIKLGDFGIAKVIGPSARALTTTGTVIGTPAYLAPEQARGETLDVRTDVYALGVVLYEMACGRLPFGEGRDPMRQLAAKIQEDPQPIGDLRPDLPPLLAEVIMRAIARQRSDRPGSAREFALAVADAATAAFGAGWLRRAGVEVMGAAELLAITEREQRAATPAKRVDTSESVIPEQTVHPRVGALAPRDSVEEEVALQIPDDLATDADDDAETAAHSPVPEPPPPPAPVPPPVVEQQSPSPPPPPSPAPPPPPRPAQPYPGPQPSPQPQPQPASSWAAPMPASAEPYGPLARKPSGGGRGAAVVLGVLLAALAGGGIAALLVSQLQPGGGATEPSTIPGGGTFFPEIERVEETATGGVLVWNDKSHPDKPHVLLTYSSGPVNIEDLKSVRQPLRYSGKPRYCFVVALKDDLTRKSQPECINGATPAQTKVP
jgi:serine/threonine protein kinase